MILWSRRRARERAWAEETAALFQAMAADMAVARQAAALESYSANVLTVGFVR